MKIRITEDQARRLNILDPNTDPIVKLEQYVKLKGEVIDGMYRNLSNLSLVEILSPEFQLEFENVLDEMETQVMKLNKMAYDYLNGLSDEQADGLDVRVDDATRDLTDKINAMSIIVNKLQELKNLSQETHLMNVFKNQEPLDVTNQE